MYWMTDHMPFVSREMLHPHYSVNSLFFGECAWYWETAVANIWEHHGKSETNKIREESKIIRNSETR